MFDMIRAEMYKLRYNKTLPILLLAILSVATLSVIITYLTRETENIQINGQLAAYRAPITDTYMLIFFAILAAEIIVSEYSRGTIKNLVASGKPKLHIYFSKLASLIVASLLFCIFCIVIYSVIYSLVFGWGGRFQLTDLLPVLRMIGRMAVLLPAIDGIVMLVSILFQSSVPTIGVCGGLAFLEVILVRLLAAVPALRDAVLYFPLSLSNLITQAAPATEDVQHVFIVGFLIFSVTSVWGCLVFKRQDVK